MYTQLFRQCFRGYWVGVYEYKLTSTELGPEEGKSKCIQNNGFPPEAGLFPRLESSSMLWHRLHRWLPESERIKCVRIVTVTSPGAIRGIACRWYLVYKVNWGELMALYMAEDKLRGKSWNLVPLPLVSES